VAIVNDVFAQRYLFPLAMGRRLIDAEGREVEVVGVVKSPRYRALQEAPEPTVYFPLSQQDYRGPIHLIVRAEDAEAMLEPLRAALESAGRPQIFRMLTFNQHLSEALTLDRLATTLVSACALAALVLATIGMYGVVADAVRRRTPEIGLRIALGAGRLQVLRLVFGEGAHLAAGGVLVGIGASVLLQRIGATYVHAFPAVDAGGLAVVPLIVALVVGAAAALPARRALGIDPTVAFRAQ
jgi:ABC-type lipoprotein release transport system permease subunit